MLCSPVSPSSSHTARAESVAQREHGRTRGRAPRLCSPTQAESLPRCSLQTPLRGVYVPFPPPSGSSSSSCLLVCTSRPAALTERQALEAEMMMFGSKLQEPTEGHHPQRRGDRLPGSLECRATPVLISSSRKEAFSPLARGKTCQWQL